MTTSIRFFLPCLAPCDIIISLFKPHDLLNSFPSFFALFVSHKICYSVMIVHFEIRVALRPNHPSCSRTKIIP